VSEFLDKVEDWRTEAERTRRELIDALTSGDVGDPVTGTITIIGILKAVALTTALTIGSSPLTRALDRTKDAA
jgi:hypothetical protein